MSDEGEKTCPLCAEEMDLTDQQLKPCKCGYDICVWCWHHIMDMAEKENTEGRCPACRTPYNKEKIVGTASKCERLVAEMSVEKKHKLQKGKSKTSEGRKQLTSVRVIQRNLVYIVGLPLNLADEDLLQRKEYFGQYGKVLKVSISRTAAGAIQHFANNTCSVYITYSKEDEAVRSIQSVHGFVLEGRPLRACFGTTKYCHAWLRNMPCTNPDCLYLHEFGSQEDSFTKDEIISEYTRGRVQQVTGATNDMQRRSGNILPPPADDYSNNSTSSWAKPISKSTTNDPANSMKGSPPNSSSGRSVALPAAASWGTRASNSQSPAANVVSSNGPSRQKVDSCTTVSFSTEVVSATSHGNEIPKKRSEESLAADARERLEHSECAKQVVASNHKVPEIPVTTGLLSTSTLSSHLSTASPHDRNESIGMVANFSRASEMYRQSCDPAPDKDLDVSNEGRIYELSSDMSALSISRNHGLQPCDVEKVQEPLISNKAKKAAKPTMDICGTREQSCLVPDLRNKRQEIAINETEADLLSFNDQRLRDPEVVTETGDVQNIPQSSQLNNSMGYSPRQQYVAVNGSLDPPFMNHNLERSSFPNTFNMPVVNVHSSNLDGDSFSDGSNGHSYFSDTKGNMKQMGIIDVSATAAMKEDHNTALDLGEDSIISNILSMDFDPWNESLTSPQNLAKLLGDGDKQRSQRVPGPRKAQNCNQSRFSFAREDYCTDQGSTLTPTSSDLGHGLGHRSFSCDFVSNTDVYPRQLSDGNSFSYRYEESDHSASHHSYISSNKISVSRSQISAPPGFLGPSRAPPPGFTSNERIEQAYDNLSGNHMFETSSLLRKVHQTPAPVYNGSVSELEFMDPAILAVGGRVPGGVSSPGLDMRSNYPSHHSSFENDNRLRLLVQRSFGQQNQRFSELGDSFPQRTDAYGVPSRIMEQALPNNRSHYQQANFQQSRSSLVSNGHWDSWNEVQSGNDITLSELLRNERLGFNKYYLGYEDAKLRLSSSGDLYNRTYGN